MKAYLEVRSQKSKGSGLGRFGGPDTYVAVQIVPDGVEKLYALDERSARKRGIQIKYFGEGYHNHCGPRSRLGRALAEAKEFVQSYNETQTQAQASNHGEHQDALEHSKGV